MEKVQPTARPVRVRPPAESPLAWWLGAAVGVLSLLPLLLTVSGATPEVTTLISDARAVSAHAAGQWAVAVLSLLAALGLWAVALRQRETGLTILAMTFFFVAVLDALDGLAVIAPATGGAAAADATSAFLWWLSRLYLALGLTLGTWIFGAGVGRSAARRVLLYGALLGSLAVVLAALGAFTGMVSALPGRMVDRALDLLPLVLFVFTGALVLPGFHQQWPTAFSRALVIGIIPQAVCQLHLLMGGVVDHDVHFFFALGQKLLAGLIVLIGVTLTAAERSSRPAPRRAQASAAAARAAPAARAEARAVPAAGGRAPVPPPGIAETGRRRDERGLRLLEQAMRNTSLGVTISDTQGRIIYVNKAEAEMHGYQVDELLGRDARIFAAVGQRQPAPRPKEIVRWERERRNVTRDGREFPVRLLSDAVLDDQGRMAGIVTLSEDISQRLKVREVIDRRHRILEAVGLTAERFLGDQPWDTSIGEGLELLGTATRVDHVYLTRLEESETRPRMQRSYSWFSPRLRSREVSVPTASVLFQAGRFAHWRVRLGEGQAVHGRLEDLSEEERTYLEVRLARTFALVPVFVHGAWWGFLGFEDTDAARTWSSAELEGLKTAARMLGAAIQHRFAQEALQVTEQQHQDVLENASDLVQSVSLDGHLQYVNRAWRDSLGYDEDEISGLTLGDVVHPDRLAAFHAARKQILTGESARVETVFVTKGGAEIPVEGSLSCRIIGGKAVATRGIFRDITERKAVEQMKEDFISTVSHELRTPLTSIIASLGLLKAGKTRDSPERTRELLDVAHRNSHRLLRLINDLLDLQRLSAGRMIFRSETVDAHSFLEEAVGSIQSFADSLEIRLQLQPAVGELGLSADRDRLMQVLNNLLSNAIKFSPSGGLVTIGCYAAENRVVFVVSDQGPGIPDHFRQRLFDKFTQTDSSSARRSGGSGLGLSIVKALVEGMEGQVRLETAVGVGTTFYVELPRA